MTHFARTGAKVGARLLGASECINAPIRAPVSTAPRLDLSSGSLEALKWLALLLMTLDHVNKHLLHASVPELFAAGRLALPLFGFVLGYNLARPGALASGGYSRTARRLAIFGTIATIPFIALGGLGWGWWPFNIMATLLVATLCAWLIEVGGPARLVAAAAVFTVGCALVEFWWPGLAVCLMAWAYCRRPSWLRLALWIGALASLYVTNRNLWALAALPLIFAAGQVKVNVPRGRLGFYAYYPAHLSAIWGLVRLMSRAHLRLLPGGSIGSLAGRTRPSVEVQVLEKLTFAAAKLQPCRRKRS